MIGRQYFVNQYPIQTLLTWIQSQKIAIPENQRPSVWHSSKVSDLTNSLCRGYSMGYLISCRNPDIKSKDSTIWILSRNVEDLR